MRRFERTTAVAAPAERVWERIVSKEGINDELMPFMRMTMPRALKGKTIADVEPGQTLGRSWQHERIAEPAGAGCEVTDRIAF